MEPIILMVAGVGGVLALLGGIFWGVYNNIEHAYAANGISAKVAVVGIVDGECAFDYDGHRYTTTTNFSDSVFSHGYCPYFQGDQMPVYQTNNGHWLIQKEAKP